MALREKIATSALTSAILGVIIFAVLRKTDVNKKLFLFDIHNLEVAYIVRNLLL